MRQGSPSTSGRPLENGNGAHASSTPHSQALQRLPESAETALLYVRFRTVAEPGLKGEADAAAAIEHIPGGIVAPGMHSLHL